MYVYVTCIAIKVEKIPVVSIGKAFRASGVPNYAKFPQYHVKTKFSMD